MRRQQTKSLFDARRDESLSPAPEDGREADQALPDSFADWLSHPAGIITAANELDQEIILGLTEGGIGPASAGPASPSVRL
jgi:hypothetical protein